MKEDDFKELYYQPFRDSLKRGRLNKFNSKDLKVIDRIVFEHLRDELSDVVNHPFHPERLQARFLRLQFHLRKNGKQFKKEKPATYYKAMSALLEFRDYLGALSRKEKDELKVIALELLKEIRQPRKPATLRERLRLKEQIRLVCVHANQRYRDGTYKQALNITDTLKTAIDEKLIKTNKCRTVRAGIYYLEGKILRNKGNYPDCEKSFSDAIDAYTDWARDNFSEANTITASYKNAMALGGIAWCKNMRGFNRDALTVINSARLLILPTEWELDKAHIDMIYADISRTFAGAGSAGDAILADAIAIATGSYNVFGRHPHERLRSRAAFALALLNYYAGKYPQSESFLEAVKDFSSREKEARWHANALILLARVRNKQKVFAASLDELLPEAIKEAKKNGLADRLVVAYIVKSEAHLGLKQYRQAVEALLEAQKINDRSSEKGKDVNSERNKGWIFLNFAQTHLRAGELGTSKFYLDQWSELRDIEYQWMLDFAKTIQREHIEAATDFIVKRDAASLSWKNHRDELACWLIGVAKVRTKSDDPDTLAGELGVTPRTLKQFQSSCEKRARKNDPF